jgi:predicted PurR-regulated permease PerM
MSETEPSETEPKKMFSRNVAIGLGIICIILVASLVGTTVYLVSTVNDKNSTINQKDSVIADLNDTINLQKHAVWVDSQTITQTPDSYNSWTFPVNVSGYVLVITTPTTNNTYVRVIYNATIPAMSYIFLGNGTTFQNFQGVWYLFQYDNQVNVTSEGAWNFFSVLSSQYIPVFSATTITYTNVEVRVGNTNLTGNTTQTVTIVYFF